MGKFDHISEGNSKTSCYSFDLPAVITCPGRTKECECDCYAANLTRIYKKVASKYERNMKFTSNPRFVDYMVMMIPRFRQFRIHVSGDFFSPDYVNAWIAIASKRPDVTFYAYTRSWRVPSILFRVLALNDLPNVNINLSVDDETGEPNFPGASDMRWCYLTKTDNAPAWLRPTDIVFRSNHIGHKKRRKNAMKKGAPVPPLVHRLSGVVCPFERGQDMPKHFSCAKCRLCVDKPKVLVSN